MNVTDLDRWRPAPEDVEFSAIRAQGAGGQHVNTSATAVQLRYDIHRARLPETVRSRLLARADARVGTDGVIVIKAQRFRSQARNREDALDRLTALIAAAAQPPKPRQATRTPKSERRRRTDSKTRRGSLKRLRGRPADD